jgi:hypothetical protein
MTKHAYIQLFHSPSSLGRGCKKAVGLGEALVVVLRTKPLEAPEFSCFSRFTCIY